MKITISREKLDAALRVVSPAVASKTTKPILACVKLTASDGLVSVAATDLELEIRNEVTADTARTGECVVDAARLGAIVKAADGDTVTITVDGDTAHVVTASGRYKLPAMPADEFPDSKPVSFEHAIEIDADAFKSLLGNVSYAADKRESEARWSVTGVLLEWFGNELTAVATDTKRLALDKRPTTGGESGKKLSAILPMKAIVAIERAIGSGQVRLVIDKQSVSVQGENAVIRTAIVEGRFPPYLDIIPKKHSVRATMSGAALLTAVRQAAVMIDAELPRVNFAFTPGKLTLTAAGASGGDCEVNTECDCDKELALSLDPAYITDFLKRAAGDCRIEMTTAEKPIVLKASGLEYLVMPLAS